MRSTARAAPRPSLARRSTRLRSTATNENSAATKNPVTKIRSRTASRPSAVAMCAGYCGVSPLQVFLAALGMAVGALVQGAVGFGGSLVGAPLLALVDVRLVPGPIGIASLVLNVLILRRSDLGTPDPGIRWATAGLLPGTLA